MNGLIRAVAFVLAAVLACVAPSPAHAQQWTLVDGAAKDVGVGANGAVWVIGTAAEPGGYGIYRRNADGGAWTKIPGAAVRIAVDPQGNAWVVNSSKMIFRWDGTQWVRTTGAANDIGIGANGSVWVIGTDAEAGGFGIWRTANAGASWTKVPGSAVRIAVDPQGNAWVVNNSSTIFRWDGTKWIQLPGAAKDVGVGADGAAWVIGTDGGIYRWNGSNWDRRTGGARDISVGPNGLVWVVNAGDQIWRTQDPQTQLAVAAPAPIQPTPAPATTSGTSTSGTLVLTGQPLTVTAPTSGPLTATTSASTAPVSGLLLNRLFPRSGTYEAQILEAIGYLDYDLQNQLTPGRTADRLSPLDRGIAQLALLATEIRFNGATISPSQALGLVRYGAPGSSDPGADRRTVQGILGQLVALLAQSTTRTDPEAQAVRQWATSVYRSVKIENAKATLDQYQRWAADPCGYEGRPRAECGLIATFVSTRKPDPALLAQRGYDTTLANYRSEATQIARAGLSEYDRFITNAADPTRAAVAGAAVGAAAVAFTGATAALTSGLGMTIVAAAPNATFGAVTTSLYAAFGGAGPSSGAIGAAATAGAAAAPIAAAVLAVVVGTMEGFAVVEADRVEPMLKMKLGAAMSEQIVIQNALTDATARNFFYLAYLRAATNKFKPPVNTVDGEIRFFCQAGYVSRFKATWTLNGQPQSRQTANLSVGFGENVTIPAAATNVVASGEWFDGINWKPLFTRNLGGPTFIGFTSYGTVFAPQVKDEYPEISSITAQPNQLTVTHGGGYVARIRVEYQRNGQTVVAVDDSGTTAGWRRVFDIPTDARSIRLQAWSKTGLVWEPWKGAVDRSYPMPPNECIKIYGTTLDPKWNNECR